METAPNPKADCVVCRGLGAAYGIGGGTYLAMHAPAAGIKRWGILSIASGELNGTLTDSCSVSTTFVALQCCEIACFSPWCTWFGSCLQCSSFWRDVSGEALNRITARGEGIKMCL